MSDPHPWERFLSARVDAMQWMRAEMKYTDELIAETLSMDPSQVQMILRYDDQRRLLTQAVQQRLRQEADCG